METTNQLTLDKMKFRYKISLGFAERETQENPKKNILG